MRVQRTIHREPANPGGIQVLSQPADPRVRDVAFTMQGAV